MLMYKCKFYVEKMETCSGSNRSSSTDEEVDFLSVCEHIAHDIEAIVKHGNLLNERQCRDLSSKILQGVKNIQAMIKDVGRGSSGLTFTPFLQILYQSLEKAKLLVSECAEEDWSAAALFQFQNETAFQEILLDVWFCFNAVYNSAITVNHDILDNFPRQDLSSLITSASVSDIESDRKDLRKRLGRLARYSSRIKVFRYFLRKQETRKQRVARHLLKMFSCTTQECLSDTSDVCKAGLWNKEMEPPGTWGNSNFLGAGSGASGVCRTQWLGVPCARKEFHGQASEKTFLKEASILSHLKHPRIVNFICCGNGETKGDRFIAMELMEKSLSDVIEDRKGKHFPLPVAVDIIFQMAEGMRYLHDKGVAHRDLKPQNVVVNRLSSPHLSDQYYCVKLVDFGMSKTKVEVSKSDSISFRGVGTTRYRAPEVHPKAHLESLGRARWFRADVYSFAMTCAHVLSLKAPFEDMEQLSELYVSLLKGERPQLPSGLPEELVKILHDCWDGYTLERPSFQDICRMLFGLKFKILGGNIYFNAHVPGLRMYFSNEDSWVKENGKGMGNSKVHTPRMRNSAMISPESTGQTSYYTAHSLSEMGDSPCDE